MRCLLAFALAACAALFPIAASAASKFTITSSSATACTSIASPAREIMAIINASSSAQTATLSLYDEGSSPTCASGDLVYSVVLGASQVVDFPTFPDLMRSWLLYGLSYKLSASAANNIVILYY